MRKISLKANAKINLGLDVTGVRENGYHEVRMIMQSLKLCDDIEIGEQDNGVTIMADSLEIPDGADNICYKAAELMRREYGIKQGIRIKIGKKIPVAAGLAGGSTDAAAVITGINELFSLGCRADELMEQGLKIGADVPFCILKGTALSEGIGEKLSGIEKLPECGILLFKPPVSVSTADVYRELDKIKIKEHPDIDALALAVREGNLRKTAKLMGNVLELVTEKKYPVITEAKLGMLENGALGAMMSGSGPTVFGIFEDKQSAERCYRELEGKLNGKLILTEPM
ncbi:MAG: 4-(cytidine 5'-diphospho)-2-C-methyl-D-erythritol kinase [Lachnospiraceae bacterium]|nr:4-(cytidine 5'-diphospho)-2-C-methyl-D-erythritol kinase [Lachnospiraceae bacterium]